MQELQEVWDTKIGSQFNHKAKQRSAIAVALTPVPHIIMLAFTGFVTWISWPGSSESIPLHVTYFKCIYSFFLVGLFSWHPTLMSLAVSYVACTQPCVIQTTFFSLPCAVWAQTGLSIQLHQSVSQSVC